MQWAKTKNAGFTIVELLIVVVVIAILAAITVVAYNGITNRANDSAVAADIQTAYKQLKAAYEADGVYPLSPPASVGLKPTKSAYMSNRNNYYYCISPDATRFAMTGISKSGAIYSITSDGTLGNSAGGGNATCALVGPSSTAWVSGLSGTTWNGWTN